MAERQAPFAGRKVLFRADGSPRLGLGHIMRCLALAEGLQERGTVPVFLVRDEDPAVIDRVKRAGYHVEVLPKAPAQADERRVIERLFSSSDGLPRLVVTDLCNSDMLADLDTYRCYLDSLKGMSADLVTIDDLNTFAFPSDVVVNPNCGAERLPYQRSSSATYLLGPRYFLFRQEFREAAAKPRAIRSQANRVVVSLGGGDAHRTTEKVLSALLEVHRRQPLEVQVALGLQTAEALRLQEVLGGFSGQCRVLESGKENLADLFLWCDVAIIGGGLTKYEAAVTGTPAIVLSQVEHQWDIMQAFAETGAAQHLGRAWGV
ncbi:MAG: UDP-2,4-diacetamido-2,4,6-trideoxy-beta-L-altropyranose hydrolase, partial [SAR202 cluster bacterium]|nr:UDP-2,4-diacetamido-2,4,6-trideoxy-beta-L-altropyranose hydrolase [SAR202 cluster bacterium]